MVKKKIRNVLFVCTGNSCRSVMAEGYLRKRVKELGLDLHVESAGTGTIPGMPPSSEAENLMAAYGVDISGHKSNQLTPGMVERADIILVMEEHHKQMVNEISAGAAGKVRFLREFDGRGMDLNIPDPVGKGMDVYRDVFDVIKNSTEGLLKWINN